MDVLVPALGFRKSWDKFWKGLLRLDRTLARQDMTLVFGEIGILRRWTRKEIRRRGWSKPSERSTDSCNYKPDRTTARTDARNDGREMAEPLSPRDKETTSLAIKTWNFQVYQQVLSLHWVYQVPQKSAQRNTFYSERNPWKSVPTQSFLTSWIVPLVLTHFV